MKNKLTLILTILFGVALTNGAWHPAQAQSYDKTLAHSSTAGSPKLSADGSKRLLDQITANGFKVRYKIRGKTTTASAVGNKLSYLRSTKVKQNAGAVVVRAVTNDRALEITTYFTLDEQRRKLMIDRRIRNTSAQTVKLQMVGEYVDPKAIFAGQSPYAKSDLAQAALTRIRSGQLVNGLPGRGVLPSFPRQLKGGFGWDCECPTPPPPCGSIICPDFKEYVSARWSSLPDNRLLLQWEQPTVLSPQKRRNRVASFSEVRFITEVDLQ